MRKGLQIAPGFSVELVNSMGCSYVLGTDGVVIGVMNHDPAMIASLNALNAEYVHRFPYRAYSHTLPYLWDVETFTGKIVIGNEPDLHIADSGQTPSDFAARVNQSVSDIVSFRPELEKYVIVQMGSELAIPDYFSMFYAELTPETKANIAAWDCHKYVNILKGGLTPDEWVTASVLEVKQFVRGRVRSLLNDVGENGKPIWLNETGLDGGFFNQADGKVFIPALLAKLSEIESLAGGAWYYDHFDGLNYVTTCNVTGDALTKSGKAWGGITMQL